MLDVGWSELLVIGVVALVVVGPKDLPKLLRVVGQWIGKVRRMASEFQGQVNEAIREAELEDVRKSVEDLSAYNPATMIRNEVNNIIEPVGKMGEDIRSELAEAEAGLDGERPLPATAAAEPAAAIELPPMDEAPAQPALPEPVRPDPSQVEPVPVATEPKGA